MALFNSKGKNGNREDQKEQYVDILEPVLSRSRKFFAGKSPTASRTAVIAVAAVAVLVSVGLFFLEKYVGEIYSYVHIVIGVPLGIALFLCGEAFLHARNMELKASDPEYLTLKERRSPSQRLRTAIIVAVILIVLSAATLSHLPQVAGGILALTATLSFYNYIRRTEEEFHRFMEGEPDPRDVEEAEEQEDAVAENTEQEAREYIELLESLPEEQRKILLNPSLNSAIAVIDDDDIKGRKKRRLFGK